MYTSDTRGFNFVGVGAGHKVLSDQARVNEKEREGERGRPRGMITIAEPITRNGSTNISIPSSPPPSSSPPHGTTFGGVACVIFLSAEITHWPGKCVRIADHTLVSEHGDRKVANKVRYNYSFCAGQARKPEMRGKGRRKREKERNISLRHATRLR